MQNKRCFFVSRIGADSSPERANSDFVMTYILIPELEPKGFEVVRADQDPAPHMTSAILTNLLTADLVVADITGSNPNVFYELAVRHSTGKPCILLLQKAEKSPFDIIVIKYIPYDQSAASVAGARAQLKSRLEFNENNPDHHDSDIAMLSGVRFLKLEAI